MSSGPRDSQDEYQSIKFQCVVNKSTLDRFRQAVMWRYGEVYGRIGSEVTRALSDRTNVLFAEANTVNPMVIPVAPVVGDADWQENVFDGKKRGDEKSLEDAGE